MSELKTMVLVTGNKGKAREYEQMLPRVKILTLKDIGFTGDIEETGKSFEENARIKVEAVAGITDFPVFADDSGLVVDALDGSPGIFSARFAGIGASDSQNRKKLLEQLKAKEDKAAWFVCVICLRAANGAIKFYKGTCEGSISTTEKGENGFGYDSLFIPHGYSNTLGELNENLKNSLSHRGRAVELMKEDMGLS